MAAWVRSAAAGSNGSAAASSSGTASAPRRAAPAPAPAPSPAVTATAAAAPSAAAGSSSAAATRHERNEGSGALCENYYDNEDINLIEVHALDGIKLYNNKDPLHDAAHKTDPCFLVRGHFMHLADDDGFDGRCWVGADEFFSAAISDDVPDRVLERENESDIEAIEAEMRTLKALFSTFQEMVDTRITAMKGRIAKRRQGAAAQAAAAASPREARATARQAASSSGKGGRARRRGRGRGMAELMAGDSDEADEATDFQRVAAAAADAAAEADSDAEEPPHSSGRKRARPSM